MPAIVSLYGICWYFNKKKPCCSIDIAATWAGHSAWQLSRQRDNVFNIKKLLYNVYCLFYMYVDSTLFRHIRLFSRFFGNYVTLLHCRCCETKKVAACPALSAMRTQNYCNTPSVLPGNTGISATHTPNCPGQPPSRGKNLINFFISIVPKSFCVFSLLPLQ